MLSLENGMRVVLASDPNCDKAACALCVGVGRLHEPKAAGETEANEVPQ